MFRFDKLTQKAQEAVLAAQRTAEAIGREGGESKAVKVDIRDAASCAAALRQAGPPDPW